MDVWTSCAGDEGGPLETGLQEQVSNHSKRRRSKAAVVSVGEKLRITLSRYVSERRTQVNLRRRVVIQRTVVKTRGVSISWDKSAGSLMTGQAATGV